MLEKAGTPRSNVYVLHCTTQYPAPLESVNLRAMDALATLGCAGVGYSDHTEGIDVSVAAAARGAVVIEKHFTLDRNLPGPDHKASLEPAELKRLVDAVRRVSVILGSEEKTAAEAERPNMEVARKSIVASRAIAAGEVFSEENICVKRPGNGISPMRWYDVLGCKAPRDFAPDELIEL